MMDFIRSTYAKMLWLRKNYSQIRYTSELVNNVYGPLTYNCDGLATSTNADFIKDEKFSRAYTAAKNTNPWPNFTLMWRIHVVCWCAETARHLEGDFVECGVNTGAYARAIMEYINFNSTGKTFFLMDTFKGLDERYITDEEKALDITNYKYHDVYEQVINTFRPFNVQVIRGSIPDTLPQCKTDKICYLSIDMNNVLPEIAAAEYFWDKVVKHGIVLLDDYGFPDHIIQKKAFDKFAAERNHEILTLPTGQGLIIKNH